MRLRWQVVVLTSAALAFSLLSWDVMAAPYAPFGKARAATYAPPKRMSNISYLPKANPVRPFAFWQRKTQNQPQNQLVDILRPSPSASKESVSAEQAKQILEVFAADTTR